MLGAVCLNHAQPGLLDKLEQAGGRRGRCLGIGIERAFACRRLDEIVEIHAGGVGGALQRAHDAGTGLPRTCAHATADLVRHLAQHIRINGLRNIGTHQYTLTDRQILPPMWLTCI